jgi:hypothetical protein
MTRPHVFPDAIDLIERMKSPDFQVVGFRSEQLDDETLVRMEYTSQWPGGLAFSGWADFDPSRNWVLRRFSSRQTINPKDPSDLRVSEMKVDYREVDPSHYLPTRIERTLHALKTDRRQRHLIEYDEIIVGPPDESLFRLSGYGLPDVPLRPVTASGPSLLGNGWFWGSLVAGGLSLAALVFSRSRRASASAGN